MIVSISQPAYLPWPGYFDRIASSDVHVVLNDVQLERSSTTRYTNRNRIKGSTGPIWLTVPLKTARLGQPLIREVVIDNEQRWQVRHRHSIEQHYSKAPYRSSLQPLLELSFGRPWSLLDDLLQAQLAWLLDHLRIGTRTEVSSKLGAKGRKGDLILDLCKSLGATIYLSGPFGRNYLDAGAFERAGIKVAYHEFVPRQYPQLHGPFVPNLSVVDLLANGGPQSLDLLRSGN